MAKKKTEGHLARNLLIGAGALLGFYALAGFLVLPWWLERSLPEQLDQRMGWQAEVEAVRVNPFVFSLEMDAFSAQDAQGQPVAAFDRLRVNLGFLRLFRGIIGFDEIRLVEPDVRVDLLQDNDINYVRDWREANPETAPQDARGNSGPAQPPKLYFQQVSIDGGELLFRDFSRGGEPAEFRVTPLDLTLNDLATWPRDGSDSQYSVMAALGEQVIEWEGELSVTPLYSKGHLRLSGLQYDTLAHFLAPYLPLQLRNGSITLESRYELAGGERFELITSGGNLAVRQLALALSPSDEAPALTSDEITIEGIGFDLNAREATVGMISIEQPSLAASRGAGGEVDWQAALTSGGQAEATGPESGPGEPFRWSVQGVEVSGGNLRWQDQLPGADAAIGVNDLSVTLGGLSHRLAEPVTYDVSGQLVSGGRVTATGQLTPAPFTFEAALSGSDIVLSVLQPYVAEAANLELVSGGLSFDGNLDIDGQDKPLTGTFSGTADIERLTTQLPGNHGELVSWELLRLAPVEFNLNPARLEIGTVTLNSPSVNVIRTADGEHNLQQIIPTNEDSGAASRESDSSEAEDPGFIFRIGELVLEQGAVAYTDRTLEPPFNTAFSQLTGSVAGISNIPPQQGRVAIRGRLAGVAPVRFDGTLGALGTEESSNLKLTMTDMALPVLSPYFGRYLGYSVDSGKLELAMDYRLTGTRLEASNEVTLDRMELGPAVASEQAINAPVKLGLALLTDRNGVIDVDLPIQGDMSNPEFSVGQIVMRAFVNLLVKAAASPFSMLGSLAELAGFSSEELGQVSFVPGTVQLPESEAQKLSALAKALKDRPDLLLNIRGAVAPEADALALLKAQRQARGEAVTGDAWAQAQQAWRDGDIRLPPEALGKLASERGVAVRRVLESTHKVPDSQLFLLDPERDAPVDARGNVTARFSLDVR
ncbi:DUF748 domain-containing protein [Marinobacter sp. VGCF2001]|uniref:DUF748 domain-containing protein n=1 Tax=Marinobacter sp. VGCF2001 TaxID=3417189 RepID=UPI003CFB96B0